MFSDVIAFIQDLYGSKSFIPLHAPIFTGNEKKYVIEAIDSTYVSSVGAFVDRFEVDFAKYVGAKKAVVTGNGTSALHAALHLLGVSRGDEVITQALTFVATPNAISYCGASPVFLDSDELTLGLSVTSLAEFLFQNAEVRGDFCYNKRTGNRIMACMPMHVFGHPVQIKEIVKLCDEYSIPVIEDAAESLGSEFEGRHTGLYGRIGVFSFNGNKIITSGGGGMLVTNDVDLGIRAKHLTTTAKVPHAWEFFHDEIGFNYRMPNLNAALIVGQLEQLPRFVRDKRETAQIYNSYFSHKGIEFVCEPFGAKSNYWLNAILLSSRSERDSFLNETNRSGVMTRPVWNLMPDLPMYRTNLCGDISVARMLSDRLVNIPSSVRLPRG
ncbi:LegC family aminotransferase [Bdellovibrio bacteriovorus]|uniref:GDP-perosamine synthase n=1 Tax=Bdellovibrio bacteriovorus (strain ATCC 15356 / DSM 50701 / NCIMB 9529 / HD100) TaxID=264462 RepID=Q6MMF4_BDEBA|nr:LegC family aminotransferase [Bdellovibrio bacteriovorus]CAE79550.1 putative aminotransferase [Bdellovibrio bacteriovorus HD100]